MLEFLNAVTDPERPWMFIPDTLENILSDLDNYVLDPTFERYGNFVNRCPQWLKPESRGKYSGCTSIFGNFLNFTHAFRLVTDDEDIIQRIEQAVNKNKERREYKEARARLAPVPAV